MRRAAQSLGIWPEPWPANRNSALDGLTGLIVSCFAKEQQVMRLVGRLERQYLAGIDGDDRTGFGIIDLDKGEPSSTFDECELTGDSVNGIQLFDIHCMVQFNLLIAET